MGIVPAATAEHHGAPPTDTPPWERKDFRDLGAARSLKIQERECVPYFTAPAVSPLMM